MSNPSNSWNPQSPSPSFILVRGPERKRRLREIILEILASTPEGFSRDELQERCQIRRQRFISLLKGLCESNTVIRTGTGIKGDPYVYRLLSQQQQASMFPKRKPIFLP